MQKKPGSKAARSNPSTKTDEGGAQARVSSPVLRVANGGNRRMLVAIPASEIPTSAERRLHFLVEQIRHAEAEIGDALLYEIAAGSAFTIIHKEKLYMLHAHSLTEYCERVFKRDRSTVTQWEQAAEMYACLGPNVSTPPDHYNQVLALLRVCKDRRREIWEIAVVHSSGRAPTARHVLETAEDCEALDLRTTSRPKKKESKEPSQSGTPTSPVPPLATPWDAVHAADQLRALIATPDFDMNVALQLADRIHVYLQRQAALATSDSPEVSSEAVKSTNVGNGGKIQPIVNSTGSKATQLSIPGTEAA